MNVVKFEYKRFLKSCLTWSAVCGILIILFMAFYPSMKDSGIQELVDTKLGALPEGFLQAFGLGDMVDFTDIIQYMAYVIQYISMATAIYAVILGVSALLEEEADGTIEFLYAQPISRREILISKIISRALLLFTYLLIITAISILISLALKPEGLNTSEMIWDIINIFIGMSFSAYIFLAIGILLSTILKTTINFTATSIGVFFITYIIGVLAKMGEGLEPLKYLSPFDYAVPMDLVRHGWKIKYLPIGFTIIIISIVVSYIAYNKKDMKI